uniref:Uncharacterized protein n=1 Tax=Tetradesmus obliquus TaxID=3088 RepID=A0A383VUP8_TETOB|eukprot:jgi/Sobl393_1/14933/SZX68593.1
MVTLVITVMLVTRLAAAQPIGDTRRAGLRSSRNGKSYNRDPDPAKLPPGREQKTLPAGQTGALSRRADAFDSSFQLVEDELLVKFKPGVSKENRGRALGKAKAEERKMLWASDAAGATGGDLVLVKLTDNKSKRVGMKAAAADIKQDPDVEYVEPNYIYTTSQTNDPRLGELWGMLAAGAGANATGAWASGFTSCNEVVVGVIDEGVQVTHPDLAAAMWTNPREVAGNSGIDDDGNGYVDDVNGFDFVSRDGSVYDGGSLDTHGTHVAGTIGAVGNNGLGVSGVCQSGLKMISAKFLGANGGTTDGAVQALNYLLDLKTRYNLNMVATSNSWGGGGYSQSLFNAINAHNNAGILFVAAAGNNARNTDVTVSYPAGYNLPNIISVGSITSTGAISSFSNFGATSVDLFAPGSGILSTWPVNGYNSISGTSMATPHVTGAVALYAAAHMQLRGSWPTAANIKAAVMDTGVYNAAYDGRCVSKRRLNVAQLINSLAAASGGGGGATPQPPSPSPPPPSPSPPPPGPIRGPKPKLRTVIWMYEQNSDSTGKWWYAWAQVAAVDAKTGQPIPGVVFSGTWSISPDNDWSNDYWAEFPYSVTIDTASFTDGWTDSDWIPTAAAAKAWWPDTYASNYAGTRVAFTLTGVDHPDYDWDRAASRRSTRQAVRVTSGLH